MPKFFSTKQLFGFTILELIAVVIIIAIIAGFAIPSYQKTLEKTYRKQATADLIAVHAAQQIKYSEDTQYYPNSATTVTVASINSNLRLNLIEQGMVYTCTGVAGGGSFTCDAVRFASPVWTLRVTSAALSASNPTCQSGPCP